MLSSTTPAEPSDRTLTPKGLIKEGFITQKLFDEVKETATRLLMHGRETAANRGLILVDTKHEFGPDERGDLVLIDEIHTPDHRATGSSHPMPSTKVGQEPEYFDKEFLRLSRPFSRCSAARPRFH